MSAVRELTIALIRGGMDPVTATILIAQAGMEIAPPIDKRSAGARRQAAWRERNKASPNVSDQTTNHASQSVTKRNEPSLNNAISLSIEDNKEGLSVKEVSKKERPSVTRETSPRDGWPEDFMDRFWNGFPPGRKTGKKAVEAKLTRIRKSGEVSFEKIMAGVARYAGSNPDPQFTKAPEVWLNKGCWDDEHFKGESNGNGFRNQGKTGHAAFLAAATREAQRRFGEGELAGNESQDEFSRRDGTDGRPAEPIDITPRRDSGGGRRDQSGPGGVFEGEILPPDKIDPELSDGLFRQR